ncbi:hypothetical protein SEA_ISSMI_76 [Streptomyces phage Issmi]|uniref:CdiI immunity protein domain-containing protein n=1 Tax=Streptomyces phage Issmi TaxID=2725628 RepID=A0A6M3T0B3_9CAUD|nr:hypothetical protein KGG87_gp76 [Streptomyces phage Issmi]QJD50722.1 hypothetical protein SEA_ISSMI_76 [Streptomyces phage Issmi]
MSTPSGHIAMRITHHGWYQTSAEHFDQLLAEFIAGTLPQSMEGLRAELQRISKDDGWDIDYSDLTTVTECLMIFAELRGLATN